MTLESVLAEVVREAVAPLAQQVAELTAAVQALRTPAEAEPELLTVREFAKRAGISQCTCRRRVADGTLAHVRVGGAIRIPSSSLRPADPADVARLVREARR